MRLKLGVILCILVDLSPFCSAQSSTKTENGLSANQNLSDSFEPLRSQIVSKSEDPSIHAKTGTEQEPIYDLDYLRNICPYADICSRAGQIVPEQGMVSCCQSCSCDPTCEARGKCCNDNLNIEARKRCYRPLIAHSSLEPADTAYIFIDTCLNSPAVDCKSVSSEPWGSMYPVYDSATDTFYYNQHCADCNGIKNYTHWEVMVSCFDVNTYSNDHIIGALYGKTCDIIFTPPNIQLEKHVCFFDLIHQCNVSGLWQNYDAGLELACSTWYSPVNWLQSMDTFANVFCLLCNGYGFEKENLCSNFDGRGSGMLLTTTIDYRKVSSALSKSLAQQTQKNDEICQKNMVRHPTKVQVCLTLKAPRIKFI